MIIAIGNKNAVKPRRGDMILENATALLWRGVRGVFLD
jgi:hypothetical protein